MFRKFNPTFLLMIVVTVENTSISNGLGLSDLKDSEPVALLSSDCEKIYLTPKNDFCSVVYSLFTQANKNSSCYFEPSNDQFNDCEFHPESETKILIHGFKTKLKPGNQFELIKNEFLSIDDFNVIIVDWTKYNQVPYETAFLNFKPVGIEVSKLINFLVNEKGAYLEDIHIIGHSLGAHVAGVAGQRVGNLGRITGLDPASPQFETSLTDRLSDKDANFVDVIHSSNGLMIAKGYGLPFPIGHINFYPNGGNDQPACKLGKNYMDTDGEMKKIKTEIDLADCRHDICPLYFLYSIQRCEFLSTECDSYRSYNRKKCSPQSHPTNRMGLYAEQIDVDSHSKFYLKTSKSAPFCLKKATKETVNDNDSD